jgi:GT2 family glycosyltransferase
MLVEYSTFFDKMKKEPNIFVIIVTYKGKRWYEECFGSLRESTILLQTVVVDNTPGDEDAEYIKTHFPEVHIIKTKENLGFGRANNLGLRYALDNGCDYVFLLNQDAWIEPETIETLVKIWEKHPEYGILSPIHLNAERTAINMTLGIGAHNRNEKLLSDLYLNKVSDVYDTNFANAAAWLLPRKTLETVGGFDPIFKHYEEDDNYLNRAIYHKLKIGVCPLARIVHDHQDSQLSDEKAMLRQKQNLLVVWTDLNKKFSVVAEYRYYIRKWLSYLLAGKKDQAKAQRLIMQYCWSMRKAIEKSRRENAQVKASWL